MVAVKWSITLTPELAEALERLARGRGDSRSALLELLLRENPYVARAVEAVREDDGLAPGQRERPGPRRGGVGASAEVALKRGRDPAKLRAITESARRAWLRAEAEGRVELLD